MSRPQWSGPAGAMVLAVAMALALLAPPALAQDTQPEFGAEFDDNLQQQRKPFLTEEVCMQRIAGASVGNLMEDAGIISCAISASEECCGALDRNLGEQSDFWGCSCYEDIFNGALEELPSFARTIVEDRMVQCDLPTPFQGCDLTSNTTLSLAAGSQEPELNQTSAMEQYSGAYSMVAKGFESFGEWHQCQSLQGAQYCLAVLSPPGQLVSTKWGLCVPDSLSEAEINRAIHETDPVHYAIKPPEMFCSLIKDVPNWTPAAITVVCILCVCAAAVLASTVAASWSRKRGDQSGSWLPWLSMYDWQANWRVLSSEQKVLPCGLDLRSLNGLRTISMLWIILGHTGIEIFYSFNMQYFSYWTRNPHNYEFVRQPYFMLYAALFAVDSFLFISGLLVAYKFSQTMAKRALMPKKPLKECGFWCTYVLARWCRLVPVLIVVMITSWFLVPNLITAPGLSLWWDAQYILPCQKYWWATLLFVQNLYPAGGEYGNDAEFCMGVTWYLAVDMQLYIFAAAPVLIAWHYGFYSETLRKCRKWFGAGVLVAIFAAAMAATTAIVLKHDVMWQFFGVGDFDRFYIKPWSRAPPYLFGLALGIACHELSQASNKKAKEYLMSTLRSWAVLLAWLLAFGLLLLLIFTPVLYFNVDDEIIPPISETVHVGMTQSQTKAYMILKACGWGLGLFVVFGINVLGRGWLVNDLLSMSLFAPFAKLTYGAYLISIVIQHATVQSAFTQPIYHNWWVYLSWWVAFSVGSYFFSFLCFMVIEAPSANLLRAALLGNTPTSPRVADASQAVELTANTKRGRGWKEEEALAIPSPISEEWRDVSDDETRPTSNAREPQ